MMTMTTTTANKRTNEMITSSFAVSSSDPRTRPTSPTCSRQAVSLWQRRLKTHRTPHWLYLDMLAFSMLLHCNHESNLRRLSTALVLMSSPVCLKGFRSSCRSWPQRHTPPVCECTMNAKGGGKAKEEKDIWRDSKQVRKWTRLEATYNNIRSVHFLH